MKNDEKGTLGLVIGLLLGLPASYFFQSGAIRAKLSIGGYLSNLPELISKYPGDVGLPVVLACGILGAAGWFVGAKLLQHHEK